jgi:hypothetical protein
MDCVKGSRSLHLPTAHANHTHVTVSSPEMRVVSRSKNSNTRFTSPIGDGLWLTGAHRNAKPTSSIHLATSGWLPLRHYLNKHFLCNEIEQRYERARHSITTIPTTMSIQSHISRHLSKCPQLHVHESVSGQDRTRSDWRGRP